MWGDTKVFTLVLVGTLLGVGPARSAVVTVSDCATDPHIVVNLGASRTAIDVTPDDLVLACALAPGAGTDHIEITAHDVTIQGPGGSVSAFGNAATKVTATGTFTATSTFLESTNSNGDLNIESAGNMVFDVTTLTVGDVSSGGDSLNVKCTNASPKCTITVTDSQFKSRHITVEAQGDIGFAKTKLITNSPLDLIQITSFQGNVNLGSGIPGFGDCCGFGGGGNSVITGNEGNLYIRAFGLVDLSTANILVAENICVRSGVSNFNTEAPCEPCSGGSAASVPADIDATDASIRNDFGKRGEIKLCADETRKTVTVGGAVLIDDNTSAVEDISELNGCETLPRSGCPNVSGVPDTDS